MKRVVFLTALFTWLCAPSALAHSLHVFAQYDGRTVSGKAYYSDMTPAAETYMEILQAGQDSPLLEGKTDRDGQFAYPINTTTEGAIKVVKVKKDIEPQLLPTEYLHKPLITVTIH